LIRGFLLPKYSCVLSAKVLLVSLQEFENYGLLKDQGWERRRRRRRRKKKR